MSDTIYVAHPAMFRAHPFLYTLSVLLIAAFGLGILILLIWYINTRMTTLYVTRDTILYEKGILSKDRIGFSLSHVRTIRVSQSFLNRMFGIGTIELFTTGDNPEFTVGDMPRPHEIRDTIFEAQRLHQTQAPNGGHGDATPQ